MFVKHLNFFIAIGLILVVFTATETSARCVEIEILPSVEVTESEHPPFNDSRTRVRTATDTSEAQIKLGRNKTGSIPPVAPVNIVGAPCVKGRRPDAVGACREPM